MDVVIHDAELAAAVQDDYRLEDLQRIDTILQRRRTLDIALLPNGLASASPGGGASAVSGYHNVWIRDAVYVAHALRVTGDVATAQRCAGTLLEYLDRHAHRVDDVLEGRADPNDPMQRPHVRFDGETLSENDDRWAHAQNDALGYVLWLCGTLWQVGWTPPPHGIATLAGLVLFLARVEYWRDEDSGHWEEDRQLHLSSVGTVVAGLKALGRAMPGPLPRGRHRVDAGQLDTLVQHGEEVLRGLPAESPPHAATDAALVFLIEPLDVVTLAQAGAILAAVRRDLQGPFGIKRYLGDSYWCADYRTLIPAELRSTNYSESTAERDAMMKAGTEAQWCIFDPLISAYYGRRYLASHEPRDLALQTLHFNRSLGQITGEDYPGGAGRCPEAYFLESSAEGTYRPNDQTPLAWTQANLRVALAAMRRSHQKGRPQ